MLIVFTTVLAAYYKTKKWQQQNKKNKMTKIKNETHMIKKYYDILTNFLDSSR